MTGVISFEGRTESSSFLILQYLTATQRPDLRPPILNVTQHDPSAISPGYIFVAPYGSIGPQQQGWAYIPFEEGPLIYDNAGVRGSISAPVIMLTVPVPYMEWCTYD